MVRKPVLSRDRDRFLDLEPHRPMVRHVESQAPYPGDEGIPHFVIDTSRNGQGPWQATPEQLALGDVQDLLQRTRAGPGTATRA